METEPTPVEEFIAEQIVPRQGRARAWPRDTISPASERLELAAKARGVSVRRIGKAHLLFHSGGRLVGSFDGRETDLVSAQAYKAAQSSRLQRGYLRAAGVPTVLETADGAQGESSPEIPGENSALTLRCYVVGESVVAAVARVPRHVIGNGSDSLGGLIAAAQKVWRTNAYLTELKTPAIRRHVMLQDLDDESVIENGRVIFLQDLGDAPGTAITVDVLDMLGEDVASLAVDAMWAFPGLDAAGVDLRTSRVASADDAAVLGVDPTCDMLEFRHPVYGADRRVAVDIIDRMKR